MVEIIELRSATPHRVDTTAQSLSEAAADEPNNGVYLVARTYRGGATLELGAHFDRMERSAAQLGASISAPRSLIARILEDARPTGGDIRFRVTAVLDEPVWYRISIEPAADLPDAIIRKGVQCAVVPHAARANATVKTTAWIHSRRDFRSAEEVYEYLLADDDGRVLEGASSNFYAVVDGALRTAGSGVLEGISRRIVLAVAESVLPVRLEPVSIQELASAAADEAFISSATRGIVPIRSIILPDHERFVSLIVPGAVTERLRAGWDTWLAEHLVPLV